MRGKITNHPIATGEYLTLWRTSARAQLRDGMTKASSSLGEMLTMITHGFLSGSEEECSTPEFAKASAGYNAAYSKMSKNLREAKFEHYFVGDDEVLGDKVLGDGVVWRRSAIRLGGHDTGHYMRPGFAICAMMTRSNAGTGRACRVRIVGRLGNGTKARRRGLSSLWSASRVCHSQGEGGLVCRR